MSLSALGSNSSMLELFQQRREAMQTMESSVQSGDVSGAQTALVTVQQDTQNIQSAMGITSSQQASASVQTTFKGDLSALMSAVQTGNLGAAQSALQTLQQDQPASGPGAAGPLPPNSNGGTGSGSSFLNNLDSMLTALLSGDTADAQGAANTLESDLPDATSTQTAGASSSSQSLANSNTSSSSPVLNDLQSLISAAQSGNANGAKQAAQNIVSDLETTGQSVTSVGTHHNYGGGRHHGDAGAVWSSAPQSPSSASANSLMSSAQQVYESLLTLAADSSTSVSSAV